LIELISHHFIGFGKRITELEHLTLFPVKNIVKKKGFSQKQIQYQRLASVLAIYK
jgi:hypothetical protein